MEKITSFTIDHIKLQPGLYVSRKDKVGAETVTTFDLRLTKPNDEPVMNTAEVHTIEHLAATYRAMTRSGRTKSSTLAPWAAGRASTCFWRGIIPPKKWCRWF